MWQAYQMDCYFRQQWTDQRLRFDGNETLRVSVNILERLWKPDTHFFNGQKSYLHTVTSPNKLLRIDPTGSILYSMRYGMVHLLDTRIQSSINHEAHCK